MKSTACCRLHLKREKNRKFEKQQNVMRCLTQNRLSSFRFLACLPVCLSVCLSTYLPVGQSVCLCLSVCLPVGLSVCLSAYLTVGRSVGLSVCLSVCLSVYQPACLPTCLSVVLLVFFFVVALFLTRTHASLYRLLICTLSEFQLTIGQTWKKTHNKSTTLCEEVWTRAFLFQARIRNRAFSMGRLCKTVYQKSQTHIK